MAKIVFLDLFKIRQPLQAILSITHRISGVLLAFFLPLWTYGLYVLKYHASTQWASFVGCWWIVFLLYVSAIILNLHISLGLRHMLADAGVIAYKHHHVSAYITLVAWVLLSYRMLVGI